MCKFVTFPCSDHRANGYVTPEQVSKLLGVLCSVNHYGYLRAKLHQNKGIREKVQEASLRGSVDSFSYQQMASECSVVALPLNGVAL